MAKVYRPYFSGQDFLLPPGLREWFRGNHLVYFVSGLIDQLDLSRIERYCEREERGYPPCHPRMMTKVLVYGYCVGVFSSRQIGKRLVEDVGFRVLAAANEPDFCTISEFRRMTLLLPCSQLQHVDEWAANTAQKAYSANPVTGSAQRYNRA